jgi:pyridinium-3,5-bisthiocarboxylic acid mononucleotide nickel chelatase
MKTLYLDLIGGIAGDMFIAALIDLGVDAKKLERELSKLKLDGYHLHVARGEKSSIAGVKFDVHLAHDHEHHHHETACGLHVHNHPHEAGHHHEHGHSHGHVHLRSLKFSSGKTTPHEHHHDGQRNFSEIKKLIAGSKLSAWVKQKSVAVFARIAEAEGKIHGLPPEEVHFHEVGAVDSIVDIVGAVIALEMLGKPRVLASPVTEGTGWIKCAHGRFPVPAPATLAILGARGVGVTQCDEPHEMITPTGAALLAEFVESFGPMENLVAEKIGFGLGTRENKSRPNVVRAVLGVQKTSAGKIDRKAASKALRAIGPISGFGENSDSIHGWDTDHIAVLETNLDDCSGEVIGAFVETALNAGALDVFHTPIQMKKNRPAVLLTVLCAENDADKFAELILRETTAFGVRKTIAERRKLRREFTEVATPHGKVTVKIGRLGGKIVQAAPEFESVKKIATKASVPVKEVFETVAAVCDRRKLK